MRYGDPLFGDAQLTEQSILEYVNNKRNTWEQHYRQYFAKTKNWYNTYRGLLTSGTHRNNVNIQILFSQVLSDVAAKCQSLFGEDEVVQFIPVNDSDTLIARKNTKLINLQLADADTYLKGIDFLLSGSIYGTAIARANWRFEQHDKMFRAKVLDQTITVRDKQTVYDGPDWDTVDILDFLPEPNKRRLKDCSGVIHTWYMDFDDLIEQSMDDGTPMYDQSAIMRLAQQPMTAEAQDAWKLRVTTYRTMTDMARSPDPYAKPIRIDEYWGRVPRELAVNGDRNVVITVANQKVVLRYEANPFWNSRLPFFVYTPMPDPHALHGTGKCEIGEKTQNMINRLANIKLDSLEIFGNPQFFVSNTSGLDSNKLISRPGAIHQVQGEEVGKVVMPVSPDIRAMGMIYEEISALAGFQQQALGIDESAIQGMEGPDRETARGIMLRRDAAMSRLAGEAELASRMFVEPLAQWFREADRQLLDLPKEIHFLGIDAIMDPVTGLPIPQESAQVDLNDLRPDYKCRVMGPTRLMGKTMLVDRMMNFMQIAGANPTTLAITNWVNFLKITTRAMGLNPSDMIVGMQVPLINQAAAGAGLSPQDFINGAGAGIQQPQTLSPIGGVAGIQSPAPIQNLNGGNDSAGF